jgi:hypothetical protein
VGFIGLLLWKLWFPYDRVCLIILVYLADKNNRIASADRCL